MLALATQDLHWAAGFLDGEGSFGNHGYTVGVAATQVQEWPLLKLNMLFGGSVSRFERAAVTGRVYYRWTLYGPAGAGVMILLRGLLSPKRQKRIGEVLSLWKPNGPDYNHNRAKTHCKRGHRLSRDNYYLKPDGGRECRICRRDRRCALARMT